MAESLAELLHDVIQAAAVKDWDGVLTKAEDLKAWARAARKAATDLGSNEFPNDGDGSNRGSVG